MAGILLSFTLVGSIFSNLFVTVGMSGLLYIIWLSIQRLNFKLLTKTILWSGAISYPVFLLHQPFIKWSAHLLNGNWVMSGTAIILLCCFPAAYCIDKVIQYFMNKLETIQYNKYIIWLINTYCAALLFIWLYIEPKLHNELKYNLFSIFIILSIISVLLLALKIRPRRVSLLYPYWLGVIIISTFQLFFLPKNYGFLSIFSIVPIYIIGFVSFRFIKNLRFAITTYAIGLVISFSIIFSIIDPYLKNNFPIETNDRWGEYPALQVNPKQVYSLIPNKTTHLKYNNYDYTLRTNSYGLPCPQFSITKPDTIASRILVIGDAFTMPEGLEYQYSYPALLEKSLNHQSGNKWIQVINAGVTGYGPVEELAQMKELIHLLKPDVILYEFFINEFEEVSLTPEKRLNNIGLISNENAVKRYFRNSQVINHLNKIKNSFTDWLKNKPDDLSYKKALLNFYRNDENSLYEKSNLNLLEQYLDSMKQLTDKHNTKFIICYVPGAVSVSKKSDMSYFPKNLDLSNNPLYDLSKPFKYLNIITDRLQVKLLDLTTALKSSPEQPVYFPDSWHWNKEGHIVVARAIKDYLLSIKAVSK
jgi:hypothetical protein